MLNHTNALGNNSGREVAVSTKEQCNAEPYTDRSPSTNRCSVGAKSRPTTEESASPEEPNQGQSFTGFISSLLSVKDT
uniref:Uncharacterized protein n=1 Tax=Brassica campestris TaxID=3711 RepID=M4EY89_BRACM